MIRLIAAVDSKLGIADDNGVPWKLSIDLKYFRSKTIGSNILMGFNTYKVLAGPLVGRNNFVLTHNKTLREGFIPVHDLRHFLYQVPRDIWVVGGAQVFEQTLPYANELYLTRIDKDFNCTKFFPQFEDKFKRKSVSPRHFENGVHFTFEVWVKK
jgi:dihydrofolate reductase